ncbi:MAG: hypothetical protein AAGL98_03880 [Planctomycetota bacterium]
MALSNSTWRLQAVQDEIAPFLDIRLGQEWKSFVDRGVFWQYLECLHSLCLKQLPCGSRFGAVGTRATNRTIAKKIGLDSREVVRMHSLANMSGVIDSLHRVTGPNFSKVWGVPSQLQAFDAYRFRTGRAFLTEATESTVSVWLASKHIGDFHFDSVLQSMDRENQRNEGYAFDFLMAINELEKLGVQRCYELVASYGPRRVRQVIRWASSKSTHSPGHLAVSLLTKFAPKSERVAGKKFSRTYEPGGGTTT